MGRKPIFALNFDIIGKLNYKRYPVTVLDLRLNGSAETGFCQNNVNR